jgi:hypothetical protein
MTRQIWRSVLFFCSIVSCLTSCATRDSGYKISNETIAFIQPGVTTRSEVVENLGTPLLELKDPRAVAYSWGKVHAVGGKVHGDENMRAREMGSTLLTDPNDEVSLIETKRWICCIALDDKDRVKRVETIKTPGGISVESAVRAWALGKPINPTP